MNIPTELNLMGSKFKVEMIDDIMVSSNHLGESHYYTQLIKLASNRLGLCQETIEMTFIHEVVHCILFLLGETEMNQDEKFVTQFSNLLYQFIKQVNNG